MSKGAHNLLQALYAEQFPDDDAVRGVRTRVEESAKAVIEAAADPVTLGIVGEFSVGKSLLLGTLLGRPDLLPVEDRATTGNVTALHLRPGSPSERTRFDGDPEIHYLTEGQLSECVAAIMEHLISHYTMVLKRPLPQLEDYDPICQSWDTLVTVCRRLWTADEAAGNPIILGTARELLRIRAAHLSGGDLLGEVVSVSDSRVQRAAIELASDETGRGGFPEFPVRPVNKQMIRGDDNALRISFPLIRRVAYKVRTDPSAWPLDSLRGSEDEVVLLDFPGLTASRSARRDEYLSRAELRNVHTIVTVFNMRKPDTSTPREFRSMLQQHDRERAELDRSILAVGNRFDTVEVPAQLANGEPTRQGLLDHREIVGRFADTARQLLGQEQRPGRQPMGSQDSVDEQISIVSAVAGIRTYGYQTNFPAVEQEHLDGAIREAPTSMSDWGDVGKRLAQREPGSHWARVLIEYGRDGGIDALRQLIESHAAKNGLANKYQVVERAYRRMTEQFPQLSRLLSVEHGSADENAAAAALLAKVFDDFRRLHREISVAARDFGDPTRVIMADGSPLLEQVRNRAIAEVFAWPYWQTFLERADRGYVTKGPREVTGRFRRAAPEGETTRTFLDDYRTTWLGTAEWGRAELAAALQDWADRHNDILAPLRDWLADPDVRHHLHTGLERLRAVKDDAYLDAMEAFANLNTLLLVPEGGGKPRMLADARAKAPATTGNGKGEAIESYPLYIGSDGNGSGSAAMPWHPDVPEEAGESDQRLVRHQVYVFRLRRQLALGVADAVTRQLSMEIDLLYRELRTVLGEIFDLIPKSAQLRQMFPPQAGGKADGDDPPEPAGSPLRDLLRDWAGRQHGA